MSESQQNLANQPPARPPVASPHVTEAVTRQVAHLARLELTNEEVSTFTSQVQGILAYIETLQEVDVKGVPPLTHPLDLSTPMREDVMRPSPRNSEGRPKVLDSAPDVLNDGYKVPPIL